MKLEYTEGCTCYGLDVDGEPFNDLNAVEKVSLLHSVVTMLSVDYDIQDIMINLLRQYGEYKHLFHCEQCGDNVCSFTLEI